MKKLLYIPVLAIMICSCNNQAETKDSAVNKSFEKNSQTMQALFESYANESIDYSRFSENAVFKGTLLGSKDSLSLAEVKEIHKGFFAKYDVKHLGEFNYLQGVNPETGNADGSVRMYYDMKVTRTATDSTEEKSVIIPIYESFDFDEGGKALYVQWYCDWTASLASLED